MTAFQLPYLREPAEQKGRRLFRKHLLPIGEVHHPKHDKLEFSRERLAAIVEAFRGGAYDVVPFVLASEETNHPHDPERIRGEVKGLELAADGLYGLIETDERGADLVSRHPNFPVSVRVVDPLDGKFKEALQHVSAAAESVVRGMKPWEAIEAAAGEEATDLSGAAWYTSGEMAGTDATTEQDKQGALSDEEKGLLRKILDKVKGEEKPADETKTDEPSDEEVQKAVEQLLADASEDEPDEEAETEPETEKVAAAMSDEDRKTLEMAAEKTKRFELKAGKAELDAKLKGYVKDGVPPAMVEAARDLLSGDETLVELANDRKPSAAKKTFEALDKAKNTIEFSERGSSVGEVDDESKEAKDLAKKMGEQFGKDGK